MKEFGEADGEDNDSTADGCSPRSCSRFRELCAPAAAPSGFLRAGGGRAQAMAGPYRGRRGQQRYHRQHEVNYAFSRLAHSSPVNQIALHGSNLVSKYAALVGASSRGRNVGQRPLPSLQWGGNQGNYGDPQLLQKPQTGRGSPNALFGETGHPSTPARSRINAEIALPRTSFGGNRTIPPGQPLAPKLRIR